MSRFILYLGSAFEGSTSRHRADALIRLGHKVTVVDPELLVEPRSKWQAAIDYRTGYRFLQKHLLRSIRRSLLSMGNSFDLIWVNGGELLGPEVLKWLRRSFSCPMLLYQNDDPTGRRDGNRFLSLLASLPIYDFIVLVRPETELEALAMGAKRVLRVFMSYDEIQHSASQQTTAPAPKPVVSFIGTLIPGEPRDAFLLSLHQAGLPISLIGNRWQRSRNWALLQGCYLGPGRYGAAYAQALASASVTIGFLSHQNRDLITQRSMETPACGGLFCAERTSEHQLLYEDGQEAVFWSSTGECIQQCRNLLADSSRNHRIRAAGNKQVHCLGVGNEDICRQILASL